MLLFARMLCICMTDMCVSLYSDGCAAGQQRATTAHVRRAAESRDFRWRHRRTAAATRRPVAIDEVSGRLRGRLQDESMTVRRTWRYGAVPQRITHARMPRFCNVMVASTERRTGRYGRRLWAAAWRGWTNQ